MSIFVKEEEELETELDWWLYLLKNLSRLNRMPAVLHHSIFESLFHIAEYSKLTPEDKMLYDASLKARWDNKNAMDYAVEQAEARGEARGEAAGLRKQALATARKMLSRGYSVEVIAELTNLSMKEIERLKTGE